MPRKCPYCNTVQSWHWIVKKILKRKQQCTSCGKTYEINFKTISPTIIDLDVAIIGLVATVFVENWYIWGTIIALLLGILIIRNIQLRPSSS